MIITKTPLRISLGGGGTDLPDFYKEAGYGSLLACTIDKYIYISIHDNFVNEYLLKYSSIEKCKDLDEIKHNLFRESLKYMKIDKGIEISSMADIPAGTGLGSSGCFAVGLINALSAYSRTFKSQETIAEIASKIEIEILHEPVGKQDQYACAVGGLNQFIFNENKVIVNPIDLSEDFRDYLEDNLLLFFTGKQRSASEELSALSSGNSGLDRKVISNLIRVRDLGEKSLTELAKGNLEVFGQCLTEQWKLKFERSRTKFHTEVDEIINKSLENGALGSKLIGAGGGGFILTLAHDSKKIKSWFRGLGLQEIKFRFDYNGTCRI
jgi:D-glycero-alpha-D-manno-heptose-7-phosphate kinase